MSTTDIIRGQDVDDLARIASNLAASKLFPDAKTGEEAFAKILMGRDLGLSPTQAMVGVHIVKGKPQVAAVTLGAFVRQLPQYDYEVLELNNERCRIEFTEVKPDGRIVKNISEFNHDDADLAGLLKPTASGEPSNHMKYPRNMNFSRAMSNGVKWYCPDATHGIPVYHDGEIPEDDRLVDGARGGASEPEQTVSLQSVLDTVHEGLRVRLTAAYGEAANVRTGQVTPAAVAMSVTGQTYAAQLTYIERMEKENERAKPPEAEVVPEPVAEAQFEEAVDAVEATASEVLLFRLNELQAVLDGDEPRTDQEEYAIREEMDQLEARLAEAKAGGE